MPGKKVRMPKIRKQFANGQPQHPIDETFRNTYDAVTMKNSSSMPIVSVCQAIFPKRNGTYYMSGRISWILFPLKKL